MFNTTLTLTYSQRVALMLALASEAERYARETVHAVSVGDLAHARARLDNIRDTDAIGAALDVHTIEQAPWMVDGYADARRAVLGVSS